MHNLQSIKTIKSLMSKYDVTFHKGLGQNFLIDRPALEKIIKSADPQKQDFILEIGPGVGTLTSELARLAGQVAAVEIDKRLFPILEETLSEFSNVSLYQGDILKADLQGILPGSNRSLKVVANLPYYITTPVIFNLLESGYAWERLVFLVQREVAERLVAAPGSKQYGASSVNAQVRANLLITGIVKPGCFIPRPKVESAIIVIKPFQNKQTHNLDLFKTVVQKAFSQRRKKLFNALATKGKLEISKELWHQIFQKSGVDESARAEELTVADFEKLTESVFEALKDIL